MALEILTKKAHGTAKASIVFVHGAWHGGWCWADTFMPYFAAQGYDCYAPSLRGHGNSPSEKSLRWLKIADYVQDVHSVVETLKGDVYLMGHSMGGYVVQKYLEGHGNRIKKTVLLGSVPSKGAKNKPKEIIAAIGLGSFLKMNFTLDMYQCVNTPDKVRTLFMLPDTPQSVIGTMASKVQSEAFLAYMDMLNKKYIKPEKIKTPLLIVSGGKDWFFPLDEQATLVETYKAPQKIYPDAPHNMFMSDGWEVIANDIKAFIEN
jgi:pimeloyl-ACP methyl ester carboxylesterase